MSIVKKITAGLMFLLVFAIGFIYFVGIAYFETHFQAGVTIDGFDCSFKTLDEVAALLQRNMESYALEVDVRGGGVEKITAEDAGLSFTGDEELKNILSSKNAALWFQLEDTSYSLPESAYSLDAGTLEDAVSSLKCMQGMVQAKSAELFETDGVYQVSPAVKGTELDAEKTVAAISAAVQSRAAAVDLEEEGCYIDASGTSEEELQENCDFLNSLTDVIITYDFGDAKETVDYDVIRYNFIDEDGAISKKKVKAYLKKLAEKYDTVGEERKFVTYDDRTITVSGGDYGWEMDVDASVKALIKLIKKKTVEVVEPVYSHETMSRDTDDIGRSYLEVDTANGTVVLYVDGKPAVQAGAHFGNGLSQGVFTVSGKEDGAVLFSLGSIYEYEGVKNSMFAKDGDIAGVSGNGADDGCVSVEGSSNMEQIYSTIQEGWAVVIY